MSPVADIPGGGASAPLYTGAAASDGAPGAAATGAAAPATAATALAELGVSVEDLTALQKLLEQLASAVDAVATRGDGDAGTAVAPPGAPALEAPDASLSMEEVILLVGKLTSDLNAIQVKAATEGLKADQTLLQEAHDNAVEQLKKIAANQAKAAKKAKIMAILAPIAKVLGLIAAVATLALTAGTAAPAVIAISAVLLAYTAVDTTMTVADSINRATGGTQTLALDTLVSEGITQRALANGASQEEAEKIGQWAGFSIQISIALGSIATGIGAARSAAVAAKAAASAAGTVAATAGGAASSTAAQSFQGALTLSARGLSTAKYVQYGTQIVNGMVTMTRGGLTAAKGFDDKRADDARANKLGWDAAKLVIDQLIKSALGELEQLVNEQSFGIDATTALRSSSHEGATAVAMNIA